MFSAISDRHLVIFLCKLHHFKVKIVTRREGSDYKKSWHNFNSLCSLSFIYNATFTSVDSIQLPGHANYLLMHFQVRERERKRENHLLYANGNRKKERRGEETSVMSKLHSMMHYLQVNFFLFSFSSLLSKFPSLFFSLSPFPSSHAIFDYGQFNYQQSTQIAKVDCH